MSFVAINFVFLFLLAAIFFSDSRRFEENGLQASFYGDSYVRVPVQDSSSVTDVRLTFRTSASNGLLMLAAGSTDYCRILLQGGSVQVGLDLGSGEAVLGSPPGVVLNNLQWHTVQVRRNGTRVALDVDGIYSTETVTPGRLNVLNIDRDVFVGGTGSGILDGDVVFFGNFRPFRGCLRDVIFNDDDVLRRGRHQLHSLFVYAVTWDCSAEFGATSDQPISFVRNSSFVAFPPFPEARHVTRVTFDLRTTAEYGLVLYSAGPLAESDFVAVEVVGGRAVLRANKGSGAVSLVGSGSVNDGTWHQVELYVDVVSVRLSVDGKRVEERINFGDKMFLDVTGLLYVGGIGVVERAVAVRRDLESLNGTRAAGGSLIGCVQNLKVDGRPLGFREAVNSRYVHPECGFKFPCSYRPCVEGARCTEEGTAGFRCTCRQVQCYRNDSEALEQLHSNTVMDVLRIQDLVVKEGGRVDLSTENIHLLYDYAERGILDTAVSFRILNHPTHGAISVEGARKPPHGFTMSDLKDGKVRYVNDGSESTSDSLVLQLEFHLSAGTSVPPVDAAVKRKYRFTLMIQVAAWNDPPEVHLPPDDTLVLINSTEVRISPRLINATDADDDPTSIEYSVLYQKGFDFGYFELRDNLGIRAMITRFTQEDINEGRLRYVHRGIQHQQIMLQVSDGKDVGEPKILKVSAVPLTVRLVANTGLVVPRNSTRLLTSQNLTFATNDLTEDIEVRYAVIEAPFDGEIQRQMYADDAWVVTSTFTQKLVDRGRVRYVHSNAGSRSQADYFRFKVAAMNVQLSQFDFHFRIVNLSADVIRNLGLTLTNVKERLITSDELKSASSVPEEHGPGDVIYHVITGPSYGQLLLVSESKDHHHHRQQRNRKRKLTAGSNFTQADINARTLSYKLLRTTTEKTVDEFEFRVQVPGFVSSRNRFQIRFEPSDSNLMLTNNGLMDVEEGGSRRITRDDLYVELRHSDDFAYVITAGPRHGSVQTVADDGNWETVTAFSNEQIKSGKVAYRHDDSETEEDSFGFTALYQRSDPEVKEISEVFEVKVVLKNDNEPRRVVERTFYVVSNRGRTVTPRDLLYSDADVDFDSSELLYEWPDIPNGVLVLREGDADRGFNVTKFHQRDIERGLVYFRHTGASNHSRSTVTVSDGLHFSSHAQEVRACESFVTVHNRSLLFVNNGQRRPLTTSTFDVYTNVDVPDSEVRFVVLEPPYRGLLKLNDRDGQRFTWADVMNGSVFYEHSAQEGTEDDFGFLVKAGEVEVRGRTSIKVTQLVNRVAVVEAVGDVTIDDHLLGASNSYTAPENVTYVIMRQPSHGSLRLVSGAETSADPLTFTQDDVDHGRVRYEHGSEDSRRSDEFHFDVHLDGVSLTDQVFRLEIASIQGSAIFQVNPVTVKHGSTSFLTGDTFVFNNNNNHLANSNDLDIIVVRGPRQGHLHSEDAPEGHAVTQFNLGQVIRHRISYIHGGREAGHDGDSLLVIVNTNSADEKLIGPLLLRISVEGQSDSRPVIKHNKILRAWHGLRVPITREHLLTEDADTLPKNLTYRIRQPITGDVIVLESRKFEDHVTNFTQEDIDNNLVFFHQKVHVEGSTVSFQFSVSDGSNVLEEETFLIQVEPLVLRQVLSGPLGAFPGLSQPITGTILRAATTDPLNQRPINYAIQKQPLAGKLVTSRGNSEEVISSFSQEELDRGVILYRHEALTTGMHSAEDFLVFDVSTAYAAPVKGQTLSVCISYESLNQDNVDKLLVAQGTSVDEGGAIEVDRATLNATRYKRKLIAAGLHEPEVYFVLRDLPVHGNLTLGGDVLVPGDNFTQTDVNRGSLVYQHDHSDSTHDRFSFSTKVVLMAGKESLRSSCILPPLIVSYNISIRAVNDQPFHLITDSPSFDLVQGSTFTITNRTLMTSDLDTPPGEIKYKINNQPSNGFLALSAWPEVPIFQFSQMDVDENSVVFFHDGTPGDSAFYFSVSDAGGHKPLFKVCNIRVTPMTLELLEVRDVEILQGYYATVVNATNLVVRKNSPSDGVWYNVTMAPARGLLYVNDTEVNRFNHGDVERGHVTYVQTDFDGEADAFRFLLTDSLQNVIFGRELRISVRPHLRIAAAPVQVTGSDPVRITAEHLNATELSFLTGSDPIYYVTRGPSRGKLRVTRSDHRDARDAKHRDVNRERKREKKERRRKHRAATAETAREVKPKPKPRRERTQKAKPKPLRYQGDASVFRFSHSDVTAGALEYVPHPSMTKRSPPGGGEFPAPLRAEDSMTFALVARNAQPTTSTLRFEITIRAPADPETPPGPGTEAPGGAPGAAGTSPAADLALADDRPEKEGKNLLIVFLISGATVMALVGFVVFKCLRRKNKNKNASKKHHHRNSPPLPQSDVFPPPSPPPPTSQPPSPPPKTVSPPPSALRHPCPSRSLQRQEAFAADTPPSSPTPPVLSSGYVRIVSPHKDRPQTPAEDGASTTVTPGGTIKKEQVIFDWENVDPELLQHCRKTNPVLHKNQYWV